MSAPGLFVTPSRSALQLEYVGKRLQDVTPPATVLDVAVVKRNCQLMLDSVAKLDLKFRAHVKTHKTTELTQLQVGKDASSIRLVVSTVSELENLVPWLLERRASGKEINVMYGMPVTRSALPRLAAIARILGVDAVGCFVDHPDQILALETLDALAWPGVVPLFVNIDVGYHREGVNPRSRQFERIAKTIGAAKRVKLYGMYSHLGTSYNVDSPQEALENMARELKGTVEGVSVFLNIVKEQSPTRLMEEKRIVLSLGASPTATAIQNLFEGVAGARQYLDLIADINGSFEVEIHAGVYPLLDMQQLATHARPTNSVSRPGRSLLSYDDLGLRILVEVSSLYSDRGEKPEAMIAAGSMVLGRDPCKSYNGWGVVSVWPHSKADAIVYDPDGSRTGWIVSRIAQEHGVLTWEGSRESMRELSYGDLLLLYPNHACIAGASVGWYLIVDSDASDADRIIDVWVRWRGW